MVAARMAVPFLQEVELGKRPKLPKSIKRQSLNEMAAFVAGKPDRASRRMSKARKTDVYKSRWMRRNAIQRRTHASAD